MNTFARVVCRKGRVRAWRSIALPALMLGVFAFLFSPALAQPQSPAPSTPTTDHRTPTTPAPPSPDSRPDNPEPRTQNPPSSSINHKPSPIASEPRAWPAAKVLDLLARYEATPEPQRPALLPELSAALKSYRKEWQGTPEAQLEFESAYQTLAEWVTRDCRDSGQTKLVKEVSELTSLRIQFLSDDKLLENEMREAKAALDSGDWHRCEAVCRKISGGFHAELPGVELTLGACYMARKAYDPALEQFTKLLEMCGQTAPETAARSGLLAGTTLVLQQRSDMALKVFQSVAEDFPDSSSASKAKEMVTRLERVLEPPLPPTSKAGKGTLDTRKGSGQISPSVVPERP